MTPELTFLALASAWGLLQTIIQGGFNSWQNGAAYGMSARDQNRPLTGVAGRMKRAQRNYLETFAFFAAAILLAAVCGRHNGLTLWGARLYFWARLAYLPLYLTAVPVLRTLAWGTAFGGIWLVLAGLFWP